VPDDRSGRLSSAFFGGAGKAPGVLAGDLGLAILAALLLILFGGVTDRLIPLFAVGAFLAFTLSQAGMVGHWRRVEPGAWHAILVNGIGALATESRW